ncbi:DUF1758 domain-containing protein [Nephila pilipes]|uniref:DUF1758 domain-containing protein n=1 Tax=Nephila pilipes TaxID=299642 RepID=A0A8X6QJT3_NEPPI|nr:DUF1758 domain-containing protein [Nephila pilipes]
MSKDETTERNVRSRGVVRKSVTNIIKGVEAESVKDEPCIETLLDKLEILFDREASLQKLDSIINEQVEIIELELVVERELEYSDSIIKCKIRIQRFIDKHRRSSREAVGIALHSNNTKLPRIFLDKFDGDLKDIINFGHHSKQLCMLILYRKLKLLTF